MDAITAYRISYSRFRQGFHRGAKGEVSAVTSFMTSAHAKFMPVWVERILCSPSITRFTVVIPTILFCIIVFTGGASYFVQQKACMEHRHVVFSQHVKMFFREEYKGVLLQRKKITTCLDCTHQTFRAMLLYKRDKSTKVKLHQELSWSHWTGYYHFAFHLSSTVRGSINIIWIISMSGAGAEVMFCCKLATVKWNTSHFFYISVFVKVKKDGRTACLHPNARFHSTRFWMESISWRVIVCHSYFLQLFKSWAFNFWKSFRFFHFQPKHS